MNYVKDDWLRSFGSTLGSAGGVCLAKVPFRGPRNGHALYRAGARMDAGWPGSFSLGPASVSLPLAI